MGCGSSRTIVVQPVNGIKNGRPRGENNNEVKQSPSGTSITSNARDGSAVSKHTTDSGVEIDELAAGNLPGVVPKRLKPLKEKVGPLPSNEMNIDLPVNRSGLNQKNRQDLRGRQNSTDILEELLMQGIIQSRSRIVRNGEAFDVMSKEEELKKRLRSERPMTVSSSRNISVRQAEDNSAAEKGAGAQEDLTLDPKKEKALETEQTISRVLENLRQSMCSLENNYEIMAVESDKTYNSLNDRAVEAKSDAF
uniref:Stathmin domain containing 1 n=1 Tax=Latimeria chalumnae TaxID=7897 RepID=M3XJ16_LATCH|nr:PREDICTED: stathmin domain-containing protein 1 isoform X1 [Latimeria chalumnae]|eukprot:XP_006012428.1 PREDICTED: stathmin domain-containing protein 1 isoform X1 [Latimeria chalumnae]